MSGKRKQQVDPNGIGGRLANLQNGRDEMNLCELPFATLSERSSGREMLHFQVEDFDHDLGRPVERILTVKGDPEFGLPTTKDEEIYLGLLKYTSDFNRFAEPEVRFSRAALFELMNWPKSDWAYRRLLKGMHRLTGVRLSYQNLWRDNRDKQWRDQGAFAILDSFQFRDSRTVGIHGSFAEQSSVFRWGAVLFQSFDSGYVKRIDYGLVRSLSPAARRLYRYLDKHFHPPHRMRLTIDLAKLAYQHIGVSRGIELDKVRHRHIGPAADELVQAGYLGPGRTERFQKVCRGVWSATFEMARQAECQPSARTDPAQRIVDALCRRGVSTTKALLLAADHTPAAIRQAVRALDEQIKVGTTIRSPDAWLAAALRNGYRSSPATERASKRPELKLFRARSRAG